jgi:hypothetical protein
MAVLSYAFKCEKLLTLLKKEIVGLLLAGSVGLLLASIISLG